MDTITLILPQRTLNATLLTVGKLRLYVEDGEALNYIEDYTALFGDAQCLRTTAQITRLNQLGCIPVYFDVTCDEDGDTVMSMCMVIDESMTHELASELPPDLASKLTSKQTPELAPVCRVSESEALDKLYEQTPDLSIGIALDEQPRQYMVAVTNPEVETQWLRIETRLALLDMQYYTVRAIIGRIIPINPDEDAIEYGFMPAFITQV